MQPTLILRPITSKEEMLEQLPLIQQLTKQVTKEEFSAMLDDMMRGDYRMVGVFENETCVGLSGFWTGTKIYSGKYLEMDNVVVADSHRSKGIGKLLCDHLIELAKSENCKYVMLDAYVENEKAHRFYEREGFVKRGFHFLKEI